LGLVIHELLSKLHREGFTDKGTGAIPDDAASKKPLLQHFPISRLYLGFVSAPFKPALAKKSVKRTVACI
jgi:hypothetical protein